MATIADARPVTGGEHRFFMIMSVAMALSQIV